VGDVHQPLHVANNGDRGGNDVAVLTLGAGPGSRTTTLHAIWDTSVINRSSETVTARAARLLVAVRTRAADPGDVLRWVEEAYGLARREVFRFPEFSPGRPPPAPITLSDDYVRRAAKTIDDQLMAAGARLGALLNSVLDP
jgi:hypothetical protein